MYATNRDTVPVTRDVGVFLVLLAAFLWGAYGGIRKHFAPRAHEMPFLVVQQLAQCAFTLVVVLPQWSLIQTTFATDKFLFLFFAGVSTLVAENMYLAATRHLSSTAAMACQHLPSDCFVSIIIDRCVQSYNVKLKYLIVASSLYLVGEGFFILVDYTYDEETSQPEYAPLPQLSPAGDGEGAEADEEGDKGSEYGDEALGRRHTLKLGLAVGGPGSNYNTDNERDGRERSRGDSAAGPGDPQRLITIRKILSKSTDPSDSDGGARRHRAASAAASVGLWKGKEDATGSHDAAEGSMPADATGADGDGKGPYYVCFWVSVALVGGSVLGFFTILTSIAMTGDGAITDPGTALLVLQAGQTLGLPLVIFIFGFWDPLNMTPARERITSVNSLFNMTRDETTVAFAVGCFISGGYAAFYYGVVAVPFAVANGLLASETLVAFAFSAFVWNEYAGTTFFSPVFTYLLLGFIFYVYAVVVLSVLSF